MHESNGTERVEDRRADLSRMRHDLRSPLGVIIGLGQVLQTELTDEEQREDVAEILSSAQKLLGLIDEFVALVESSVEEEDRE